MGCKEKEEERNVTEGVERRRSRERKKWTGGGEGSRGGQEGSKDGRIQMEG